MWGELKGNTGIYKKITQQGTSPQLTSETMASVSASLNQPCQLENLLQCSICLNVFNNPVTTLCGHSFCKQCLERHMKNTSKACPICKAHLHSFPVVNISFREVVQQIKQTPTEDKFTGAPGEVACDICTEPKLKANKSCLECLHSYCSAHLEFHILTERLKGHKLVDPVKNLDSRACLSHGRPLVLYSRSHKRCVCVRCLEEDQHVVVSAETEWRNKMIEIENTKQELQQKSDDRKRKMDKINTGLNDCQEQLEKSCRDIETVFTAMSDIVEEAKAAMLRAVKKRRMVVEKEAKDLNSQLEAEINNLEATIFELEDISELEDHILFLQKYPCLQDPTEKKDWTDVKLDTSLPCATMRKTTTEMLDNIQDELEELTILDGDN